MKGQSAIEYLTTYGWMLVVLAVIGGAIFSVIQGVETPNSSSFDSDDISVEDFGLTQSGFQMQVRSDSPEEIRDLNISIIDEDTGDSISSNEQRNLKPAESTSFSFENVTSAPGANTLTLQAGYSVGELEGVEKNGSITDNIRLE